MALMSIGGNRKGAKNGNGGSLVKRSGLDFSVHKHPLA